MTFSTFFSYPRILTSILAYCVQQLAWGLYDQTNYHFSAFGLHLGIAVKIFAHYIKSIPKHFIAHFYHQYYLRKLGFVGQNDLVDVGTIFWKKQSPINFDDSELKRNSTSTTTLSDATAITGMANNKSGNPAHVSLASLALQQLWEYLKNLKGFDISNAIFIDFGSGTGLAVLSAITQPFSEVIGVELDAKSCELAEKNLNRFMISQQSSSLIQTSNVTLLCEDMVRFEFKNRFKSVCTETQSNCIAKPTILLYMYEPLWTLNKNVAHRLYMEILTKARASGHCIIVAYFDCGLFSGNALSALIEIGAEQLHCSRTYSLEFGTDGHMWIYRL